MPAAPLPLATERFQAFTLEHLGLVAGFVVFAVALVLLGRSHRGTPAEERFRRGFALVIPCFTVPLQLAQLRPSDWDIDTSLPIQLCDLAWMAAIWALWTRRRTPTALVYYWGLVLTMQGVVTPSLAEGFPDPRYFGFWGMHFLTIWAAVYLTIGLGVAMDWHRYRLTVACTAVWAAAVFVFNLVADTNYGYLNAKPSAASILDVLGPWPLYVLVEVVVLLVVWAALTWPWVRSRQPALAA